MTLKFLIPLILLTLNIIVGYSQNDSNDLEYSEKNAGLLDIINQQDTIIIKYQAADYGEWGGHWETIYLQRDTSGGIKARFIMDEVPRDIVEKDGIWILNDDKRVVVKDITKILSSEEEKLLHDFLIGLFEQYLKAFFIPFSNYSYFDVRNSNGTFNIFHNNHSVIVSELYRKLRHVFLF